MLGLISGCMNDDPESFAGKSEWSALQSVEYSSRERPIVSPEFQKINDHEFMCIPATDGTRIWIMLRPEAPPYYKQMPKGNYVIEKSLIDRLMAERRLSTTVEQVLQSHASHK